MCLKQKQKKGLRLNIESQVSQLFANDDQQIFLATKTCSYMLNLGQISKLSENLLFKNNVLNQELEILFPQFCQDLSKILDTRNDRESNDLFDKCLEHLIDSDFIMKCLWHRIYDEQIVMRFISMRHSNYFYFNQNLGKKLRLNNLFFSK